MEAVMTWKSLTVAIRAGDDGVIAAAAAEVAAAAAAAEATAAAAMAALATARKSTRLDPRLLS